MFSIDRSCSRSNVAVPGVGRLVVEGDLAARCPTATRRRCSPRASSSCSWSSCCSVEQPSAQVVELLLREGDFGAVDLVLPWSREGSTGPPASTGTSRSPACSMPARGDDGNAPRRSPRPKRAGDGGSPAARPSRTSSPSRCPNRRRHGVRGRRSRAPPVIAGGRDGGREWPRAARPAASGVVPRGRRLVPAPGRGVSLCARGRSEMGFEPVDPKVSFPELERADPRVLERADVFAPLASSSARALRAGSSTRARRPRTAAPASTTSRRAPSRTSTRASRR